MCSSDTNQQSPTSSTFGSPWSMPSAFRPASSTPQPFGEREITVVQRNSAFSKPGRVRRVLGVHQAVGAGLQLGHPAVDVPGAGAAAGHDVAAHGARAASSRRAIERSTRSAFVSPGSRMRWPS